MRLRPSRTWTIPLGYDLVALALGLLGPPIGRSSWGGNVARMTSASAIGVLSSVGTGMMAMTGIVFSMVFIGLQFASTSYSPRLLREIRNDRSLLHALGVFTGTFLFSVLALRAVDYHHGEGVSIFVVGVALVWLLASVVMLATLVPAVQQLRIDHVLEFLGSRGAAQISRIEARAGAPSPAVVAAARSSTRDLPVSLAIPHESRVSRLLHIDVPRLVGLARRAGGVIRVPYAIGDTIQPGEPLALLLGAEQEVEPPAVRRAFLLDRERTIQNDPAYAMRLLVDIAIRALSPAINDPSTAVGALDQIELLLRGIGNAQLDPGCALDEAGMVRVLYDVPAWDDLLALALTEIQQYGRDSVQVERRMGALLTDLLRAVPAPRRPAIQKLLEGREVCLRAGFPREDVREQASRLDRQGLGHSRAENPTCV
jgi:uncharacterized membrane protein